MNWTHKMCSVCWYAHNDGDPVRLKYDQVGKCCFCGIDTQSGIYVRHDPRELTCEKNHEEEKE